MEVITKAQIASMRKTSAYKLMLSISAWLVGSKVTLSREANIFDRKILNIGNMTPAASALMMPTIKIGNF